MKGRSRALKTSSFYPDESLLSVKSCYVKEIREVINSVNFGPELLLLPLELEANYGKIITVSWVHFRTWKNISSPCECVCVCKRDINHFPSTWKMGLVPVDALPCWARENAFSGASFWRFSWSWDLDNNSVSPRYTLILRRPPFRRGWGAKTAYFRSGSKSIWNADLKNIFREWEGKRE